MDQIIDRKKFWLVRKKPLYIALGLMLVIIVPLFALLFGEMHVANKALDAFSQRLIAKDYDGAYSLTSEEFQSELSKPNFADQQAGLCAKLGPLKEVRRSGEETTSFDAKGAFTTVDAIFVFEKTERQFSFKLKKTGDSWRIYEYKQE